MSTDSNPELDDQDIVPELKKYQVNLSLTDLFTTLHERPRLVVEAAAAQQASQPACSPDSTRTSCSTCSASANLAAELTRRDQSDQSDRPRSLESAEAGITMLTTVPQADIARSGVSTISVGSIGIGPISIGQLVLDGPVAQHRPTGAELRNFRVNITHHMTLDWHLHIEIPGHVIDESGTEDLGTPTFACNFGNLNIPGLESIKLDIASLTADNIAATANAIGNLAVGRGRRRTDPGPQPHAANPGLHDRRIGHRRAPRRRLRCARRDGGLGERRPHPRRRLPSR